MIEKNELIIRKLHASIFYSGDDFQCNICENTFSTFVQLENGEKLCPFCGSISRNRLLWKFLNEENKLKGHLLHFSPSRTLYRTFKKLSQINYISTDFENEFLADKKLDITQIDMPENSFDLIICYHVLEHIENDQKAMSELFRILKPGGTAVIQTPFKEGDIYEDFSIKTPEKRLEHYGQADHVRIYSAKGLKERLNIVDFNAIIKQYNQKKAANYHGLKLSETVLLAQKN